MTRIATSLFSGLGVLTLVLLGAGTAAAQITPSMTASRTSGVAPLLVSFDATLTTHANSQLETHHELDYRWDFGDPDSGTWELTSGLPKNSGRGFIAAHVYDEPGTYTVTLQIADPDGATVSRSISITVADPAVVYSGSNTICVSSSGNFAGCPTGAARVTGGSFDEAVSRLGNGKRVLLARGDTWSSGNTRRPPVTTGPATLGAYGNGPKPKVVATSLPIMNYPINQLYNLDLRLMDVEFVGIPLENKVIIEGLGGGTLFYRLEMSNASRCFSGSMYTQQRPYFENVGWVEVYCHDLPSGAAYAMYWGGKNLTLMGNRFENIGQEIAVGHTLRFWYADRMLMEHNIIRNCPRNCLKLHAPYYLTEADRSKYILMSDNQWYPGTIQDWDMAIGPKNTTSDQRLGKILIEREYAEMTEAGTDDYSFICWADDCVFRNNVFSMRGTSVKAAIWIGKRGIEPAPKRARVYNNSCFNSRSDGSPGCVNITAGSDHIVVGNLLQSNNSSSRVLTGSSGVVQNADNIIQFTPQFESTRPLKRADFRLLASSPAIDAFGTAPLYQAFVDAQLGVRPEDSGGNWDVGASEYGSEPAPISLPPGPPPGEVPEPGDGGGEEPTRLAAPVLLP